jgi:hypothetical protein
MKVSYEICAVLTKYSPFLVALASTLSAQGAKLSTGQLLFPDSFVTSVKTCGAIGDRITDDRVTIQSALANGRSDVALDYGPSKGSIRPSGVLGSRHSPVV